MSEETGVAQRLQQVRARLAQACVKHGRDPADARLVAVSKRHSADAIREAYGAGQRDFGENYAQELIDKAAQLGNLQDLRWHFIGHLQRNKARLIVDVPCLVHTLDSEQLAVALQRRLDASGGRAPVLVQVNLAGEAQKHGAAEAELPGLLTALRGLDRLEVQGLMLIPPVASDPAENASSFSRLAELAARHGLAELSMGMSADMEVAVACGATLVRVGTAIFGPRPT